MNIIILIISLALLILAHEFGHFITAKKSGVRVDEFGIGFPPKLFGKKYGETEYSFNLLPFGGFVRIFGENPDEESLHGPDKARSFIQKPKIIQAAIIGAGVFFNVLLAWALISVGFMSGMPVPVSSAPEGVPVENARVVVTSVQEETPAELAGLKAGDTIHGLRAGDNVAAKISIIGVQEFIAERGQEEVVLGYTRGGIPGIAHITPQSGVFGDTPAIGISMDEIGTVRLAPPRAVFEGARMTAGLTFAVAGAFSGLIADAISGNAELTSLTGPVGMVGLIGDAAGFGFAYLLGFIAIISLNLAVLNLLPIPALDGGRLFFLAIEAVKGSRLSPRFVAIAHATGFAVLILFMLAVTYQDIARLVAG